MVDVPGHPAPGVEPVQSIGSFEDLLGRSGDTAAQETPDCGVDKVHLFARQCAADCFLESLWADCFQFFLFSPLEDALEDGTSGNEVAFRLALPGKSTFDAVEQVFVTHCEFVVEEALTLL